MGTQYLVLPTKKRPILMEALRQALAQPDEMQERIDTLCLMYEQACKQKDDLIDQQREQIAALRKALARQELFALPDDIDAYERGVLDGMQKQMQSTVERAVNAMSQPLKQDWVGLTDADIDAYALDEGVTADKAPPWMVKYARDIEAKLKEKNT